LTIKRNQYRPKSRLWHERRQTSREGRRQLEDRRELHLWGRRGAEVSVCMQAERAADSAKIAASSTSVLNSSPVGKGDAPW
jgi:hypothetical protein